jgi:hypothetical protein
MQNPHFYLSCSYQTGIIQSNLRVESINNSGLIVILLMFGIED